MNQLTKFEEKNIALFQELQKLEARKKEIEAIEKDIKEKLLIGMENNNIVSIDNDYVRINYIAATSSESINLTELRQKDPELFNQLKSKYNKTTYRKPYVKITTK